MHRSILAAVLLAAGSAATARVAAAQPVAVTLSEWKIAMSRDTVKAGAVSFRIKNGGAIVHGFYVLGENVDKGSPTVAAGQEASLNVTLKPGTYEVFCPMSENSHKMAGMTHKLVVIPGDAAAPAKKPVAPVVKKKKSGGQSLS